MKKYILLSVLSFFATFFCKAQNVGIGTVNPDASAVLDITGTGKGLLIPRMATGKIASISNPAKGLLVYDSSLDQLMVNFGTPETPNWQTIAANGGWSLTGNRGTTSSNFIGTVDNQPLLFRLNNQWAGDIDSSRQNVYIGYGSGANTLGFNQNTAIGHESLNTVVFNDATQTGQDNTANGSNALSQNQAGLYNTANGSYALPQNTTGTANTATGVFSLRNNTSGGSNTANGEGTLVSNLNDGNNTASGVGALQYNNLGENNTANGYSALSSNTIGEISVVSGNTASGSFALNSNTAGSFNTAFGSRTLFNTIGTDYNTAIGYNAGSTYNNDQNNVFAGANTDANAADYHNVVAIGQGTIVTGSSMARFGNSATVSYGGWAAWSNVSDGRFKTNIKENVPGLDFINQLRPVTYHLDAVGLDNFLHNNIKQAVQAVYTKALQQKTRIIYTGFVAQEVEAAAKRLGFDFSGVDAPKNGSDVYGLRYDEFVAPLIKAVQELSMENDELQKQIDELKALIKK